MDRDRPIQKLESNSNPVQTLFDTADCFSKGVRQIILPHCSNSLRRFEMDNSDIMVM